MQCTPKCTSRLVLLRVCLASVVSCVVTTAVVDTPSSLHKMCTSRLVLLRVCLASVVLCVVTTAAVDTLSSPASLDNIEDDDLRSHYNQHGLLLPHATHILKSWLYQHMLVCQSV